MGWENIRVVTQLIQATGVFPTEILSPRYLAKKGKGEVFYHMKIQRQCTGLTTSNLQETGMQLLKKCRWPERSKKEAEKQKDQSNVNRESSQREENKARGPRKC